MPAWGNFFVASASCRCIPISRAGLRLVGAYGSERSPCHKLPQAGINIAPLALTVRTTQNLDKCAEFFGVLWIETKLPPYPHLDQGWAKPGNC